MEDISAQELKERMDKGEVLNIIDVREQYEYDEVNIGAILIPLGELTVKIEDYDEWHNKEVIVHCKSGARSKAAKAYMLQNGFMNVRSLTGGINALLELKN